MGSLTKGIIGKEDLSIQTNTAAAETFSRLASAGSTISLTKIPDIWDGTGKIRVAEARTQHFASHYSSLLTAVSSVNSLTDKILYIDNGDWAIGTTDLSAYTSVVLAFLPGATVSPTVGTTLTIYSPSNIIAQPNQQIFSGAGTVVFTKAGVVYPHWWGAKGDGTTNDTTAVQAALTAAEGGTLDFGDSEYSYVITTALTVPSNIHLIARGATLDASGLTAGTNHVLVATGTISAGTVMAGADVKSYTATVASAAGLAVDDVVLLTSTDNITYDGVYLVDYGEFKKIRSIVGLTITFTTPLSYTFTTTPLLKIVTWKEDIHIDGLRILGSDDGADAQRAICLRYVKRFSVKNCTIDAISTYGIEISACYEGEVSSNTITGVFYDGSVVTTYYGIVILDSTQYVNVINNIGNKNRHLVVTLSQSTGQGYFGQPMFCKISGNIAYDSMAGDAGYSYAFENHGFGTHILWDGNIADGCHSGFNIENGTYNTVVNNIIKNYEYCGILIGGSGSGATNLLIANNQIMDMTDYAAGVAAILVEDCSGSFNNLVIKDNVIRYPHNSFAFEFGIGISPNTSYQNCSIEGNKIYNDAENTVYQIYLYADSGANTTNGWNIINNQIFKAQYGIAVYGDRCVVRGNVIRNTSVGAAGYGVFSDGTNNLIDNNTCIYIKTGICTGANAVTNIVKDNVTIDCTDATSYTAVGSVIAPADIQGHIAGAEMHYDV